MKLNNKTITKFKNRCCAQTALPLPGHVQVKITNGPNHNTFARGDVGGITGDGDKITGLQDATGLLAGI